MGSKVDEEATTDICCRKEVKAATAKRTDEVNLGRYRFQGFDRAADVEVALPGIQPVKGTKVEHSQYRVADNPPEAAVRIQERHPASQRLSTSTGALRKRTKRPPARTHSLKVRHKGRKAQTTTVSDPISLDELAALDADNKHLKRLLADLLGAQNIWLKKMLERFDTERDMASLASGKGTR